MFNPGAINRRKTNLSSAHASYVDLTPGRHALANDLDMAKKQHTLELQAGLMLALESDGLSNQGRTPLVARLCGAVHTTLITGQTGNEAAVFHALSQTIEALLRDGALTGP